MNVNTMTVPEETLVRTIGEIKSLPKKRRSPEDEEILTLFQAMHKRGARLLNIVDAFKQTGLNERGQPRLAIARADWKDCVWNPDWINGGGCFFNKDDWRTRATVGRVFLPGDTYDRKRLVCKTIKTAVPYVPANVKLKPDSHLRNYHILFEVVKWEEYNVDPFLLKHMKGSLYIVVDEWELTELERSILTMLREAV